ncbi:ommochrome-binding protein-like [Pieris napi]|uniref:ommochrome-binding protein-like n=1 Tax=Pieris napi TaxID=78633 RepID=UPI001FBA2D2D|nr:ommochrome-binding protein-like [Pieris napi]XP_047513411.1 ommochrome-binding protein-like [Pieris napi]XP_047513412.1 ommochrome-binding protein-like [Pieris napi]
MKVFLIISLITCAFADKRCRGIDFDQKYFNVDIIKEGINHLHDIALNRNDNNVYFTYETLSEVPSKVLGYLDIATKKADVIHGIRNATAITIDQFYGKVYVGGADGLFKINDQKLVERLPIQDDIRSLYFRDALYFTNWNREAYKFEDGYATLVRELRGVKVDKFVIDNDDNIFFTIDKKLFRVKLGTRAVNSHEMYTVDYLTTDIYHRPYICTSKGVYMYNKYKYVYDKVSNTAGLKGLTFNKRNEPLYAVADYLVKLKLSELPCFED